MLQCTHAYDRCLWCPGAARATMSLPVPAISRPSSASPQQAPSLQPIPPPSTPISPTPPTLHCSRDAPTPTLPGGTSLQLAQLETTQVPLWLPLLGHDERDAGRLLLRSAGRAPSRAGSTSRTPSAPSPAGTPCPSVSGASLHRASAMAGLAALRVLSISASSGISAGLLVDEGSVGILTDFCAGFGWDDR